MHHKARRTGVNLQCEYDRASERFLRYTTCMCGLRAARPKSIWRSNWDWKCYDGRKSRYPAGNPSEQGEKQQEIKPTVDTLSRNRTQAIFLRSKRHSHQRVILDTPFYRQRSVIKILVFSLIMYTISEVGVDACEKRRRGKSMEP